MSEDVLPTNPISTPPSGSFSPESSDHTIPAALAHLFRRHPSGFMIVDDQLRYVEVNDAWCGMTGYPRHELVEMGFLEITHPDDRLADRDLSRQLFAGEIPYFELEKRWIRSDLSVLHGRLMASALHRPNAPSWGIAIIDPVAGGTHEPPAATEDRGNDSIAVRVHPTLGRDLLDMLTAILGNAEAIEADLGPHSALPQIEEAVERATLLARSLIALGVDSPPSARPSCDFRTVLAGLRPALEELIQPPVATVIQVESSIPAIRIDAIKLDQILLAVMLNARDAMRSSGGAISMRATADDRDVFLSITDTGPGMTEAVRQRVFDPFFTTKPPGRGNGLSLALARAIVEGAGGEILVRSEPGVGATIAIALPRADREAGDLRKRAFPIR